MSHDLVGFVAAWSVMCVAMMIPTAIRPARRIAQRQPRRWAGFMASYGLAWMATAPIAYLVIVTLDVSPFLLLLGWSLVGVYQALPSTGRLLRACRSLRIYRPATVAGLTYARSCVLACLPLMLMAMLTLHELLSLPGLQSLSAGVPSLVVMTLVMAGVTGYIMWQKAPSVPIQRVRTAGACIVGVAALAFTLGALQVPVAHDMGEGHAGASHAGIEQSVPGS